MVCSPASFQSAERSSVGLRFYVESIRVWINGSRMSAHHLQHADAIAHRQKVVRIWVWV